jgi:hypothetical protein
VKCMRDTNTDPRAGARLVGGSRRPFSFANERAPKLWIVEYHSVLATKMFQRSTFLCLNSLPLAPSPEQDPAPACSIAYLMHLHGRTLQEAGFGVPHWMEPWTRVSARASDTAMRGEAQSLFYWRHMLFTSMFDASLQKHRAVVGASPIDPSLANAQLAGNVVHGIHDAVSVCDLGAARRRLYAT